MHNRVVNAIIDGIKSKIVFLLVERRNNNLPADGKIPNVEFQKNGYKIICRRLSFRIKYNAILTLIIRR